VPNLSEITIFTLMYIINYLLIQERVFHRREGGESAFWRSTCSKEWHVVNNIFVLIYNIF